MKSCKDVLSKANKTKCINLLNSVKSNDFFSRKNKRKAAVLVPLCKTDNELALLYTVRALHLKVNGGDIAFPGGMFNDSDRTLENTALRETHEEIGILQDQVDIWGKGPEIHREDVTVTPVLAYIGQLDIEKLNINSNEVALAFPATLENLCSPENFRVTKFRAGNTFIYQTPVYLGSSKRIWGLTAYITHLVLSSLIPEVYKKKITFSSTICEGLWYKNKKNGTYKKHILQNKVK